MKGITELENGAALQHLALQIANEAATYVSANNDGNQYVQTKQVIETRLLEHSLSHCEHIRFPLQNAFARQHNPAVNEYARVGGVEGGSAAREQVHHTLQYEMPGFVIVF